MAEIKKRLGKANAALSTIVTAYAGPTGAKEAIVSSITFCNRSTAAALCAMVVSAGTAGGTTYPDCFLYWDLALPADDTFVSSIGITLSGDDQIRVAADSALASAVSILVFGVEIS